MSPPPESWRFPDLLPPLLRVRLLHCVAGISGKSQVLFALVFLTRYLDLFTQFVSVYNTAMKILFIVSSCATVYLIYRKFRPTYDGNHDTFRIEFLLGPCLVLALIFHYSFTVLEVRVCAVWGR
jgi:ER lumen protein retaining receptor